MIEFIQENWQMFGSWVCCGIVVVLIGWKAGTETSMESIDIEFEDYKD